MLSIAGGFNRRYTSGFESSVIVDRAFSDNVIDFQSIFSRVQILTIGRKTKRIDSPTLIRKLTMVCWRRLTGCNSLAFSAEGIAIVPDPSRLRFGQQVPPAVDYYSQSRSTGSVLAYTLENCPRCKIYYTARIQFESQKHPKLVFYIQLC